MASDEILPPKLVEMREWATEQSPPVRGRVLLLCDALEQCGLAVLDARRQMARLQREAEMWAHELERRMEP